MISDTIKYIGVDDLDIDLFESQYVVPEGMSYNSYLIDDEKIAIMDTADRRKGEGRLIQGCSSCVALRLRRCCLTSLKVSTLKGA